MDGSGNDLDGSRPSACLWQRSDGIPWLPIKVRATFQITLGFLTLCLILVATAAKPTRPQPAAIEDQYGVCQLADRWALIVCDGVSPNLYARHVARLACDSFMDVMTRLAAIDLDTWRVRIKEALR